MIGRDCIQLAIMAAGSLGLLLQAAAAQQPQTLPGPAANSHAASFAEIKRIFDQEIEDLTLTDALSSEAFQNRFERNYESVRKMQVESNRADRLYSRSPEIPVMREENVAVHAYMAMAAARIGYEELFERHMQVALQRIRRYSGLSGQAAQEEFERVLALYNIKNDFCRYALEEVCRPAPGAGQTGDDQEPPKTFFQDYRRASGNPIRLVFDRSLNQAALEEFAIRVADPEDASPYALLFANVLNQHLRDPIVKNWFLEYYLDQWFRRPKPKKDDQQDQQDIEPREIYIQDSPIRIEPDDYFEIDPGDVEKMQWRDEAFDRFKSGMDRIPFHIRIPDGKYFLYPRDQEGTLPEKVKPNLVVDRDEGIEPAEVEIYMNQSNTAVRVVPKGLVPDVGWRKVFNPDFRLLRFDVGRNNEGGGLTGGVELRTFHRLLDGFAIQTQVEGAFRNHHDTVDLAEFLPATPPREQRGFDDFGTRELQFDIGPVVRYNNIQFAIMQSLRRVDRSGWDRSGTVGQFFFNVGYIFGRGQVGFFMTHGNQDNVTVRRVPVTETEVEETFLAVTDQTGFNFNVHVAKNISVEGAFGYVESELNDNAPGGVVRVNLPPFWGRWKFSAEFGINESFVSQEDNWRFGFGVRLGEWGKRNDPRTFVKDDRVQPVFVPRVRYETLVRRVRGDNRAPVADAGPDMLDVIPFTHIILDGTNSFDPDGDPLTFQWKLLDDCEPETVLQDADQAVASFVIGNGESCSAKLTVTDTGGLTDMDVKLATSQFVVQPVIVEFFADPAEIRRGESSKLTYRVENAETVTISNVDIPDLDPMQGMVTVTPEETTTFVLTACNVVNQCATAEATVLVRPDFPVIVKFTADDSDIRQGESTVLRWETEGATRVTLTNEGATQQVALDGSLPVMPDMTTTFTLTATNDRGEIVQASLTIRVRPADLPRIVFFRAEPAEIREGEEVTLSWETEAATRVFITDLGIVEPDGMRTLTLNQTTTFNMTASNEEGEFAEAQVTVTVRPPLPEIVAFTANPAAPIVGNSGDCAPFEAGSRLSWETRNAVTATLTNPDGIATPVPVNATGQLVCLAQTTTFTLTVSNNAGEIVSASLTVEVRQPAPQIFSFTFQPVEPPPSPLDDPGVVERGSSVRLTWDTNFVPNNANWTISITNAPNPTEPSGSVVVQVEETTTFVLTVSNGLQSVSSSVTVVTDVRPRILSFTVTPDGAFPSSTPRTLMWQTVDAARAEIQPLVGSVPTSGSRVVQVSEQTTFTLIVFSEKGLAQTADVVVRVTN